MNHKPSSKKRFFKSIALILISFPLFSWTIKSPAQPLEVVTEILPPYQFIENGKLTGVSIEVVAAVLQRAGLEQEIKAYPWARAYKKALNQPNVLIFPISRTPERESNLIGPESLCHPPSTYGVWMKEKILRLTR